VVSFRPDRRSTDPHHHYEVEMAQSTGFVEKL
jgi:hypothetical protein